MLDGMKTTDPQHELLDVVDAHNQVIDQKTRGEIHRLNLRHRACHMIVLNSSGRIFVQRRSLSKDNGPGLWDSSAAGHVDASETPLECAIRELKEELGLCVNAEQLQLHFQLEASESTGMEFASIFTLVTDDPVSTDPVEIMDSRWCSPVELDGWIEQSAEEFTGVFLMIWQRLRKLEPLSQ